MKKTTSSKLSKQLAKYGALTAAIAGVADVSGQIIYTDVTPDFAGNSGDEFFLDLNQDAINDFRIQQTGYNLFIEPLTASNSVLGSGSSSDNYVYPYALSSGAVISAGQTNWLNQGFVSSASSGSSAGAQSLNYGSYSSYIYNCSFGNWCDETDKFLGLRFIVGGNTHYGWARLDAVFNGGWTIKDFAFNATPNASIEAGQETLSIETSELSTTRIVALNKTIGLYDLSEAVNYTLFNISGKKILSGHITTDISDIDANGVATGVYILELNGIESKSVIRKKVIL